MVYYKGDVDSVAGALLNSGLYPVKDGVVVSELPEAHVKLSRRASVKASIAETLKLPAVQSALANLGVLKSDLIFRRRTMFSALKKIASSSGIPNHMRATWSRAETTKILPVLTHASRTQHLEVVIAYL